MYPYEPAEVGARYCDNCGELSIDYERASDFSVICYDCIEKIMENQDGEFRKIERSDAIQMESTVL